MWPWSWDSRPVSRSTGVGWAQAPSRGPSRRDSAFSQLALNHNKHYWQHIWVLYQPVTRHPISGTARAIGGCKFHYQPPGGCTCKTNRDLANFGGMANSGSWLTFWAVWQEVNMGSLHTFLGSMARVDSTSNQVTIDWSSSHQSPDQKTYFSNQRRWQEFQSRWSRWQTPECLLGQGYPKGALRSSGLTLSSQRFLLCWNTFSFICRVYGNQFQHQQI